LGNQNILIFVLTRKEEHQKVYILRELNRPSRKRLRIGCWFIWQVRITNSLLR